MTRPIPPRKLRPQLPLAAYRWLIAGQRSAWYYLDLTTDPDRQKLFWEQHCDAIVLHHIKRHPGTRPLLWWRFSAPEPRRRVGGEGSPLHECSAGAANLIFGVPMSWRRPRDFLTVGTPISDTNPPMYESEATYLARHKLFLPHERKRLTRSSYTPQVIINRDGKLGLMRQDRFQQEQQERFRRIGPLRALLNVSPER
jgi:hypothetical protein